MITENEYQNAKRKPELRKDFLRIVYESNLDNINKYVSRLVYRRKNPRNFKMRTLRPLLSSLGLKGRRTYVIVYGDAFEFCKNLTEFNSVLKHEKQHAKDTYNINRKYMAPFWYGYNTSRFLPHILPKSLVKKLFTEPRKIQAMSELHACKVNLNDIKRNRKAFSKEFMIYLSRKIEQCSSSLKHN
ncbi:MAG: hypothetical protein WC613_01380 [Candidatus Aenigmatarchaeota archaeon]